MLFSLLRCVWAVGAAPTGYVGSRGQIGCSREYSTINAGEKNEERGKFRSFLVPRYSLLLAYYCLMPSCSKILTVASCAALTASGTFVPFVMMSAIMFVRT